MPRRLLITSLLAAGAASAVAAPLNLNLNPAPDITSGFIDVVYNAATDVLSASGFALTLEDNGVPPATDFSNPGAFSISATVTGAGVATGGTLSIGGTVNGFGPTLLTGTLTAFGFPNAPGGNVFEFLFQVTGGALATPAYYGLPGSTVGVILNAGANGFNGSFASSFNNNGGMAGMGAGVADTAPIPEPAALTPLALALLLARRR